MKTKETSVTLEPINRLDAMIEVTIMFYWRDDKAKTLSYATALIGEYPDEPTPAEEAMDENIIHYFENEADIMSGKHDYIIVEYDIGGKTVKVTDEQIAAQHAARQSTQNASKGEQESKPFTVISFDENNGQVVADHVQARSGSHAFCVAAQERTLMTMVVAMPGHLTEKDGQLCFPDPNIVDADAASFG